MLSQERSYGRRLLPQVLDDMSSSTPERLYATIPRITKDLSQGFHAITVKDVARCVNALAWWLQEEVGRSDGFETLCYIGIPDIRGAIFFLAAIKCGYKVWQLSSHFVLGHLTTIGPTPFSQEPRHNQQVAP